MNFLAHFLVAENDEELRLGSLLGDVVKGRVERYDHPGTTEGIRAGIRLHRAVDSFSDTHDAVRRSRQRLVPAYGHLAGVLVDVFYDHVLARTWADHHAAPLPAFARDVYRTLRENLPRLPREAHSLVGAMTRGDWLTRYASLAGIDGTLREMAHRTAVARGIAGAAADLDRDYDAYASEFAAFMPDLRTHAAEVVRGLPT